MVGHLRNFNFICGDIDLLVVRNKLGHTLDLYSSHFFSDNYDKFKQQYVTERRSCKKHLRIAPKTPKPRI